MKKILLTVLAALVLAVPSFAAAYNASTRTPEVGVNLLNKNGIPSANVKFMVVSGNPDNSEYASTRTINVSTNDLTYAGNDNEVAAVIASELGHIISGHGAKNKFLALFTGGSSSDSDDLASSFVSSYKTLKEDKEADNAAVDLMVSAGYNPLAIIVVLTKQTGTYWETIQGKPANAERAMNVYDYVSYAYPEKIKAGYGCNEYRNFLTYANSVVAARDEKAISKNTKNQQKAKKKTASNITKFKTRGGLSGWDAAYGLFTN